MKRSTAMYDIKAAAVGQLSQTAAVLSSPPHLGSPVRNVYSMYITDPSSDQEVSYWVHVPIYTIL